MKNQNRLLIKVNKLSVEETVLEGQLPSQLIGVEEVSLSCPNPLEYTLRAQLLSANLLVQGTVSTVVRFRCDRCLSYNDLLIANHEVSHYLENVTQDVVDLTEDLREDMLISIPQKLLCEPECKGLCPVCGGNLNSRPCDCNAERPGSEVWNQLDGLEL